MGLLGQFPKGIHGSKDPVTFRIPLAVQGDVIAPVSNLDFLFSPSQVRTIRIGEFAAIDVASQFREALDELSAFELKNGLSEDLAELHACASSDDLGLLPRYIISQDLATHEVAKEERIDPDELYPAEVSENLHEPLARAQRVAGKCYATVAPQEQLQPDLFSTERDASGYRRAYHEEARTRTKVSRRILSVWDLIFPLLQPPLRIDFPAVLDLPSPLYPYQIDGVKFLLDRDCALLGDDMGTGKTVQSLVAMRMLFQLGKIKSALIVCPLSVLRNWDRELERWAPTLSVTVVRGPRDVRETCWRAPAHVRLTTYDTLRNDVDSLQELTRYGQGQGDGLGFDLVIIDECQKIKNLSTGISRAVRQLKPQRRWGLSGTPIENRLEDLASIFAFLKPGLFKTENLTPERAKNNISPYFLRRRKADVLRHLPPKIDHEIWIPLDGEQRRAYELAEKDGIVHLHGLGQQITVHHVLALLTKLKQLCNVDAQTGESAKLEWLRENLEDIVENKDKALIYSQYREESGVKWLERELRDLSPLCYVGGLTDQQRERVLTTFERIEKHPILLMTRAGGLGLNLTAANYVIHVDHWWNPATTAQATDRVHRIGQQKKVFVYHLWTEQTVEERIYRILERKRRLYEEVIDVLSNVQGSGLSEDELFELFELKRPQRATVELGHRMGTPEDLLGLSPDDFEKLVANLYRRWGYGVRVTGRTRDGGIDLLATTQVPGGIEKLAVQCKRFARPVAVEHARELLGVITNDTSITKGVLVSATTFTDECRRFCESNGRVDLIDGPTLLRLLNS